MKKKLKEELDLANEREPVEMEMSKTTLIILVGVLIVLLIAIIFTVKSRQADGAGMDFAAEKFALLNVVDSKCSSVSFYNWTGIQEAVLGTPNGTDWGIILTPYVEWNFFKYEFNVSDKYIETMMEQDSDHLIVFYSAHVGYGELPKIVTMRMEQEGKPIFPEESMFSRNEGDPERETNMAFHFALKDLKKDVPTKVVVTINWEDIVYERDFSKIRWNLY